MQQGNRRIVEEQFGALLEANRTICGGVKARNDFNISASLTFDLLVGHVILITGLFADKAFR